jgi:hypothetical protein
MRLALLPGGLLIMIVRLADASEPHGTPREPTLANCVPCSMAGESYIIGKASGDHRTAATLSPKWWSKSRPKPNEGAGSATGMGRSMARGPGVGSKPPPSVSECLAVLPPPGSRRYRYDPA